MHTGNVVIGPVSHGFTRRLAYHSVPVDRARQGVERPAKGWGEAPTDVSAHVVAILVPAGSATGVAG